MSRLGLALLVTGRSATQKITTVYLEVGAGLEGGTADGESGFGPSLTGMIGFGQEDWDGFAFTNGVGGTLINDGARPWLGIAPLALHFDATVKRSGGRIWRWSTLAEIGAGIEVPDDDEDQARVMFGLGAFTGPTLAFLGDSGFGLSLSGGGHVMYGTPDTVAGGPQVRVRVSHTER